METIKPEIMKDDKNNINNSDIAYQKTYLNFLLFYLYFINTKFLYILFHIYILFFHFLQDSLN